MTLDMPLGAHMEPMPGADLSPPGLAEIVADAFEELGLEDVTLVGNDTGGAICQLVASRRPERLGRLVLTSCDSYDNFPPKLFAFLAPLARLHGLIPLLFAPLRLRARAAAADRLRLVTKRRPIDRDAEDSYVLPLLTRKEVRCRLRAVVGGHRTRHTLEAAERLRSFDKPVLLAWSAEDKLFPRSDAERLAGTFPDARLEWIEDARTFSAEDQPGRVAELIGAFVTAQRTSSVPSRECRKSRCGPSGTGP